MSHFGRVWVIEDQVANCQDGKTAVFHGVQAHFEAIGAVGADKGRDVDFFLGCKQVIECADAAHRLI